jgi:hypothetical protein
MVAKFCCCKQQNFATIQRSIWVGCAHAQVGHPLIDTSRHAVILYSQLLNPVMALGIVL